MADRRQVDPDNEALWWHGSIWIDEQCSDENLR